MAPRKAKAITKPLDVYIRVSRTGDRSGDSFISPEVQKEAILRVLAQRGITVGKEWEEMDVSGGKMKRPKLDAALARIESGESGGIAVAKIDRFARTLVGGLLTLERIHELGGVVVVADNGEGEPLNTATPMGNLVVNLMLSLAQFELERIRDSWDTAREKAVARGIHVSSRAPAGYRMARSESGSALGLERDPLYGPLVTEAFRLRATGSSLADVARHLYNAGVPTASNTRKPQPAADGGPGSQVSWSIRAVQLMMSNRVYLGEARSGDYVKEDAHPPLVDLGVWRAVQNRRADTKPAGLEGGDGHLLGGGLLRCSGCNSRLGWDTTKAKRGDGTVKRYGFYRCKAATCTARVSISAEPVEAWFQILVAVALHTAGEFAPAPVGDEAAARAADLAEARAYEAELVDAVAAGDRVPPAALAAAGDRVAAAAEAMETAAAGEVAPESVASLDVWNGLSVPEKRRLMKVWFGSMTVKPGKGQDVLSRIEWAGAGGRAGAEINRIREAVRDVIAGGRQLLDAA